ncbi:hypothetical protein BDZ85DRAFT_69756 [Elsinoe ampelina]|uniref:Uncharacterized protein n=1 Tax=Elsinoe ampelina TaxID=302913 RepID=A0A6A6GIV1_9PEZI|nr:hypothetical protein BDZ85DRAFT_69756 [Elsinoe ampelina]
MTANVAGAACAALSHRGSRLSAHPTTDDTCGASGARQQKRPCDVPFLDGIHLRSQVCPRDCSCGSSNLAAAVVPGRDRDERCTRSVAQRRPGHHLLDAIMEFVIASHINAETLPATAGESSACVTITCARACVQCRSSRCGLCCDLPQVLTCLCSPQSVKWLFLQIFDSAEAKVRTRCH